MALTLADRVSRTHDGHEAEKLEKAFFRLGLPLPRAGEFGQTSDGGYLVFLQPVGCIIRITNRSIPLFQNDTILQPLGSIAQDYLRLDINPGVESPDDIDDYHETILPNLLRFNLGMTDCTAGNIGYLPGRRRIPVVIDFPAVHALSKGLVHARKTPNQDRFFSSLKTAFAAAQSTGRPEDMGVFWKECRTCMQFGYLSNAWDSAGADAEDATAREQKAWQRKIGLPTKAYGKTLTRSLNF